MPIISTRVGGIPEIFGRLADRLLPADDAGALAKAIAAALDDPASLREAGRQITARVHAEFSLSTMVDNGLAAYREAIARHRLARAA
jgi:glycosyltransferase involved in cell wall biosynthesis